jgi:hypothetical protein
MYLLRQCQSLSSSVLQFAIKVMVDLMYLTSATRSKYIALQQCIVLCAVIAHHDT